MLSIFTKREIIHKISYNYRKYEKLIQEKVTDEYCKDVIVNLTSIIEEAYVYTDFLKAPD